MIAPCRWAMPYVVFRISKQSRGLKFAAWLAISGALAASSFAHHESGAEMSSSARTIRTRTTDCGVRFGFIDQNSAVPTPTVILMNSHSAADALQDPFGGRCAELLVQAGFRCVTIDIPCHGDQRRMGEPDELDGWANRAAKREDFVADVNRRLSSVLDDLINRGLTDPARIVACGTSRGGFLACHFAAHDSRVRCVTAFAPVTDLSVLEEFRDIRDSPFVSQLAISKIVDRLAGRPIWIVIGDRDERVGTEEARSTARRLTQAARLRHFPSRVEFQIVSEPRGHTLPPHVGDDAATWIQKQLPLLQTDNSERTR